MEYCDKSELELRKKAEKENNKTKTRRKTKR